MATPPFICPHCETQLDLPEDVWYYTCTHCQHRLDLKSQFAYLRGLDAFTEGQEVLTGISMRRRRPEDSRYKEAITLFREAYSSLQVAFTADLALAQKSLGAEMMARMSYEFMKWNMVSPLEMSYWKSLITERNAQDEYDELKEKLSEQGGIGALLQGWHWRIRQKQLLKALIELDGKLKMLERQIEFIDVPRGRNENWKP